MAALTGDVTKGVLSGSGADTIATGGSSSLQETWSVIFRNYSTAARPLTLRVNGTAASDVIFSATLQAGESVIVTLSVGAGDYLTAETDTASSISWMCTKGVLV